MSYQPPPPPPGYNPYQQQYTGYGAPPPPMAPMPHPTRRGGNAIIGIFVGALVGVAVLVGIIVFASQPPPPPACPEGVLCQAPPPAEPPTGGTPRPTATTSAIATPQPTAQGATPAPGQSPQPTPESNAAPFVGGSVWRSQTLGYSFEYDGNAWTLDKEDAAFSRLLLGPVELDIIGYPSSTSVDAALQDALQQVDSFVIGRAPNTRPYDALLGPGIGYIRGKGAVFSGTFKNADGTPGDTAGITLMAATQGKATVVLIVLVDNPDSPYGSGTLQHAARSLVDRIVKTFLWEGGG
jgi:hypothetical protein